MELSLPKQFLFWMVVRVCSGGFPSLIFRGLCRSMIVFGLFVGHKISLLGHVLNIFGFVPGIETKHLLQALSASFLIVFDACAGDPGI